MDKSTACMQGLVAVFAGAQVASGGDFPDTTSAAIAPAGLTERAEAISRVRFDARTEDAFTAWQRLLADSRGADELVKLQRVNTFFNRRTTFGEDLVIWRQKDYWATPLETLGRGAGDCEDFSIAKYATLRLLGIPDDKLRLIYVRVVGGASGNLAPQAHMVLGYYRTPDAEPQLLDNLIDEVRGANRRPDLFPVFSFNSEGLWVGGGAATADPTARLSRWRGVLERMHEEGLR